jgi:hypothetical protein
VYLTAVLVAALLPAAADAAPRQWATVNVCDTAASPHSLGIRAGMQGTGHPRRLYMRFRAQWIGLSDLHWRSVPGGTSPWVLVGLVRRGEEQAGWTFDFDKPASGGDFRARGVVDFQWRAKRRRAGSRKARWVVVKRRRSVTRGGLPDVDGGDPPGTSLASCLIR